MAINLQKVTIQNRGDSHFIDLTKNDTLISKEIIVNLNWSKSKKNFLSGLFGKNNDVDLDLGCYYELRNGQKTVIDGVQFSKGQGGPKDKLTRQGRYTDTPWIWHSGDDRGVSVGSGENILINPSGISNLKRIIVYCFIYDGVVKWDETNAVITVKVPGNPEVEVEMGKQQDRRKFCAIAEILFHSHSIEVKKLVTFHKSHAECDLKYNWGLKWTAGSK